MAKKEFTIGDEKVDVKHGANGKLLLFRKGKNPPHIRIEVPNIARVYTECTPDGAIVLRQNPPARIIREIKRVRGIQEPEDTSHALLGRPVRIRPGESIKEIVPVLRHLRRSWRWEIDLKNRRPN